MAKYDGYFGFHRTPFEASAGADSVYVTDALQALMEQAANVLAEPRAVGAVTGLPGAGRSSFVIALTEYLRSAGHGAVPLDADGSKLEGLADARLNTCQPVAFLVDNAELLTPEAVDELDRLLQRSSAGQPISLCLVGDPEIEQRLADADAFQPLAERLRWVGKLRSMAVDEQMACINHRLHWAGHVGGLFEPGAGQELHRRTGGVPGRFIAVCDQALYLAYADGEASVHRRHISQAAACVGGARIGPDASADQRFAGIRSLGSIGIRLVVAALSIGLLAALWGWYDEDSRPVTQSPEALDYVDEHGPAGQARTADEQPLRLQMDTFIDGADDPGSERSGQR